MIFQVHRLKLSLGRRKKMSIDVVLLIVCAICSYFFGNFNWAIFISKIKKSDVRQLGSGNPGTLNMGRNFGLKIGLLVFCLDIIKGVIPTLAAFFIFRNRGCFNNTNFLIKDFALYLCGFCAVLGHIYPIFYLFKGGKGIASSIGVFLFIEFSCGYAWGLVVVMALVAAGLFIYFTEFGAMGSFIAITPSAICAIVRLNITYIIGVDSKSNVLFYALTAGFVVLICWCKDKKLFSTLQIINLKINFFDSIYMLIS